MPWGSVNLPGWVVFILRHLSFCGYSIPVEDGIWEDWTGLGYYYCNNLIINLLISDLEMKERKGDKTLVNENPFVYGEENFDPVLIDSVMESFTVWKEKNIFENSFTQL